MSEGGGAAGGIAVAAVVGLVVLGLIGAGQTQPPPLSAPTLTATAVQPDYNLVQQTWEALCGDAEVRLTWSCYDSRIVKYQVNRRKAGDDEWEVLKKTSSRGFVDGDAEYNSTYDYAVWGLTEDGYGPRSNIESVITPIQPPVPLTAKISAGILLLIAVGLGFSDFRSFREAARRQAAEREHQRVAALKRERDEAERRRWEEEQQAKEAAIQREQEERVKRKKIRRKLQMEYMKLASFIGPDYPWRGFKADLDGKINDDVPFTEVKRRAADIRSHMDRLNVHYHVRKAREEVRQHVRKCEHVVGVSLTDALEGLDELMPLDGPLDKVHKMRDRLKGMVAHQFECMEAEHTPSEEQITQEWLRVFERQGEAGEIAWDRDQIEAEAVARARRGHRPR